MTPPTDSPTFDTVFAPVRSQTAFEETLERLGTAIKLGLLAPGARLPAERELCTRLEISRSTLRQALTALVQSGHLHAVRGRGGGTFVSDRPPPADPPSRELLAGSTLARSAFGDDVVDHYLNMADVEIAEYDAAVTDWERVRGFERL